MGKQINRDQAKKIVKTAIYILTILLSMLGGSAASTMINH